nr:c-type cytochrome biogenesis protein CcsB [Desulfobacterales bacterium]
MNSSYMLSIVMFVYLVSTSFYVATWVYKRTTFGMVARIITITGFACHSIGMIMRWVESYQMGIGHAPLSNLYESLVFFSWTIILIYLIIEFRYKNQIVGAFVTPFAFLAMAYASLSPNIETRIQPLVPALRSNWLIAHVTTCFLGYASFAIACGLGIIYLMKSNNPEGRSNLITGLPRTKILDIMMYNTVVFGFLFLTAGIITGAVWANSAWGSYWSWDPKETWSLITWLVYAVLIHARMVRGWEGTRIAYLSIMGFVAVLFTYFGVNYIPGLHSYGQ